MLPFLYSPRVDALIRQVHKNYASEPGFFLFHVHIVRILVLGIILYSDNYGINLFFINTVWFCSCCFFLEMRNALKAVLLVLQSYVCKIFPCSIFLPFCLLHFVLYFLLLCISSVPELAVALFLLPR